MHGLKSTTTGKKLQAFNNEMSFRLNKTMKYRDRHHKNSLFKEGALRGIIMLAPIHTSNLRGSTEF
jgi:hypothetical protein